MKTKTRLIGITALGALCASSLTAALNITVYESGVDVIMDYEGSVDTTLGHGLVFFTSEAGTSGVNSFNTRTNINQLEINAISDDPDGGTKDGFFGFTVIPASSPVGDIGLYSPTQTSAADAHGVQLGSNLIDTLVPFAGREVYGQTFLTVSSDYVSGSDIDIQQTYASQTIVGMNLLPGTYVWAWEAIENTAQGDVLWRDEIVLTVVPEFNATALYVGILAGGFLLRRRRCSN